jgi:glycosyltransferase involved in cell wall biosynthesis
MSVVEAMAMGTPVVTTRTCPWQEVETEKTGFWVPQRPESVADAISKLLQDRESARAMGARGKKLVESRYAWPSIGGAMRRLYDRIVGP